MIKLFVSDLDGTLLTEEKWITQEDRKALEKLRDEGIHLCLASGRMHAELTQVMQELGWDCHRVSQNGSFVYTQDEQLLHAAAFEPKLAKQLYDAAKDYGFAEMICIGQTIYTPRKTEAVKRVEARMFMPFIERHDIAEAFSEQLAPCKLSYFGDIDRLRHMQAEIEAAFPGQVDAVVADTDCVDLMPVHVSKGAGLRVLLQNLGWTPEEVAVIGDSFNDLSMFELTPFSFAMTHSLADVRKQARRTAATVAEAVDWVLQHNSETATVR